MEITIFAKKRTTKEGKAFTSYLTTLTKKDGETQTVSVKFHEECGNPPKEECPMNIIVHKPDCNMAKRKYTREDTGEETTSYTLWVSAWERGSEYVDHSLDDYDI